MKHIIAFVVAAVGILCGGGFGRTSGQQVQIYIEF